MSFKVNDLVLCVDARPAPGCMVNAGYTVREGATYVVRAVQVCCCTRLALVGLEDRTHLYDCICGTPQTLAWFAWRFVKVGRAGCQGRADAPHGGRAAARLVSKKGEDNMTFKVNDLVLCVDARPLSEHRFIGVREGAVYTVQRVLVCCATRLALEEQQFYGYLYRCSCGAVQPGSYFGWRFVKIGNTDYAVGARETVKLAQRRDQRDHVLDAVGYLTKEVR